MARGDCRAPITIGRNHLSLQRRICELRQSFCQLASRLGLQSVWVLWGSAISEAFDDETGTFSSLQPLVYQNKPEAVCVIVVLPALLPFRASSMAATARETIRA
ncbi:hypothetical protein DL546_008650 [Coniochaeta pulveracea]|uniref:Uncharacterized protein n=1 Tax=Coniochaeta pulveracea TaxID=177199 RepID=A0A420YDN6_9PEZI|nr:hypothetical protein DL546_008650 [Coniochaeta pulveracea]